MAEEEKRSLSSISWCSFDPLLDGATLFEESSNDDVFRLAPGGFGYAEEEEEAGGMGYEEAVLDDKGDAVESSLVECDSLRNIGGEGYDGEICVVGGGGFRGSFTTGGGDPKGFTKGVNTGAASDVDMPLPPPLAMMDSSTRELGSSIGSTLILTVSVRLRMGCEMMVVEDASSPSS